MSADVHEDKHRTAESETEENFQLTEEEEDAAIAAALECPCVADLREGPCGQNFVDAFTCFHKSKSTPKGNDCQTHNFAFVECLKKHPAAVEALSDGDTFQKLNSAQEKLAKELDN